ncbi:MAG: heparinase II/III family protein [Kiritimatiellae bacterium]|nr:heparinase II/III family protein [Kiritimatiellia bacterium]
MRRKQKQIGRIRRIGRIFVGVALLLSALASAQAATNSRPADKLDETRVRQIAAMLPERPVGLGRPITDRRAWSQIATHKKIPTLMEEAEKILTEPVPFITDEMYLHFARTGKGGGREGGTRWRQGQNLSTLVFAECVANKGRFLPHIEKLLRTMCEQKTWSQPRESWTQEKLDAGIRELDLHSTSYACILATTYWIMGDRLSPPLRRLMRETIRDRILTRYLDAITGRKNSAWWLRTTNNWNAVCLAGVTGTGLIMLESRADRALWIAAAEHYITYYLKGFPPDGYCTEGVGYWNYGFRYFRNLTEMVYQATGGRLDLMRQPEARAPAAFGPKIVIINGVCPAFADCHVDERPFHSITAFVNRRFGMADASLDGTLQWGNPMYEALLFSFPNSATQIPLGKTPLTQAGIRSWFPDGGVLIGRPHEGSACRMGVALKGGHNAEHHNHNDIGSFVVVAGKRPVLLDPGISLYTKDTFSARRYESKTINSYGHPVPVVAGKLQREGRQARGEVLKTEFTAERDTLQLDLRSAYDVKPLQKLERRFEYVRRGAGALIVHDQVLFDAPQSFGTALMTFGTCTPIAPDSLRVEYEGEAVMVEISAAGSPFTITADLLDMESTRKKWKARRVGIDLTEPVKEATITVTIRPEGT